MIDVRNLDPAEEDLIRATDVSVALFPADRSEAGVLGKVRQFVDSLDAIFVHVDADVLDSALQPNHPTAEPDGLDVEQTLAVVDDAMASGKVVGFGVVSINPMQPGALFPWNPEWNVSLAEWPAGLPQGPAYNASAGKTGADVRGTRVGG